MKPRRLRVIHDGVVYDRCPANGDSDLLDGQFFDEKAVEHDLAGIIGEIQDTRRLAYLSAEMFNVDVKRF